MALDTCVQQIICGLSRPVLLTLDALIQATITELNAIITNATSALAILQLPLTATTLALSLAEEAVASVTSALSILPLDLIEGCAGVGDLNKIFVDASGEATAGLESLKQKTTRYLSMQDEINATIELANKNKVTLDEVHNFIVNHCL